MCVSDIAGQQFEGAFGRRRRGRSTHQFKRLGMTIGRFVSVVVKRMTTRTIVVEVAAFAPSRLRFGRDGPRFVDGR